jgi:digeranylgeranylglycerophospholipid reductase
VNKFDVAVIGGGPIGSAVANNLAENGISVAVLERKQDIGIPSHCSGLVSVDFVNLVNMPENLILNKIKGGAIYSFKNNVFRFKRTTEYAAVINRSGYDKYIAELAESRGAKYIFNANVKGYERFGDHIRVYFSDSVETYLDANIVVISTGGSLALKKMFGFNDYPGEDIKTIQVETDFDVDDQEIVYVYMNNSISHKWFSWLIPVNKNRARIGLGTDRSENLNNLLDELKKNWVLLKDRKVDLSNRVVWHIPSGFSRETVKDNLLVVGDAAFQVKPFSGGGLYTGTLSASFASTAIIDALNKGRFSKDVLGKYEIMWRGVVGREIKMERIIRDIYKTLHDVDKDEILKNLDRKEIICILANSGKIEQPWKAGFELIMQIKTILIRYARRKLKF